MYDAVVSTLLSQYSSDTVKLMVSPVPLHLPKWLLQKRSLSKLFFPCTCHGSGVYEHLLGTGLALDSEISTTVFNLQRMKPMLRRLLRDLFKDTQCYGWDSSPALQGTKC